MLSSVFRNHLLLILQTTAINPNLKGLSLLKISSNQFCYDLHDDNLYLNHSCSRGFIMQLRCLRVIIMQITAHNKVEIYVDFK